MPYTCGEIQWDRKSFKCTYKSNCIARLLHAQVPVSWYFPLGCVVTVSSRFFKRCFAPVIRYVVLQYRKRDHWEDIIARACYQKLSDLLVMCNSDELNRAKHSMAAFVINRASKYTLITHYNVISKL